MTIDFSLETMEARRKGSEIFKMVKEKKKPNNSTPELLDTENILQI